MPMDSAAARKVCDLFYLALVVWREARGATPEAQIAVAHSIMNRVARPSWWGRTLDEVVTKRWQYSSMAAPGDPQLITWPRVSDSSWLAALGIAEGVLAGWIPNPFPGADSYHDTSIPAPKWATDAAFVGQVTSPRGNALRFFNVDRDFEMTVPPAGSATTSTTGDPTP